MLDSAFDSSLSSFSSMSIEEVAKLTPGPKAFQVYVLKDGSDGKEASIRVESDGGFLLQALGLIRSQQWLLEVIFPNLKTELHITTDYILRPGDQHVTILS